MKTRCLLHVSRAHFFWILSLAVGVLLVGPPLTGTAPDKKDRGERHNREKGFYEARAFQDGKPIPVNVYDRAFEQWRKIPRASHGGVRKQKTTASGSEAVTTLNAVMWTPIGPSPVQQGSSQVNGRVSAIAVNPNNANVIYQGSSGGGVWKTVDGGATWTPLTDQQPSLGTGEPSSVAIDPNNTDILYVGTSGRFVLNISKGILKSTDGGGSWIVLGSNFPANNTGNADNLFAGQNISTIIVDPANGSALYLAASNGLFRSTDTGQNWTLGAPAASVGNDSQSLVLDTSSPTASRILFAGINGSGVFRSNNSAQNWTQVLSSATAAVASNLPVPPAGGSGPFIGKVVVTLAPPTSPPNSSGVQVIYAAVEAQTFDSLGNTAADVTLILRSTDQGANWNFQSSQGGSQGGYDLEMGVDPASPGNGTTDIIYLGLVGQFRSADSGVNFANVSNGQHVDEHSLWTFFRPPSGSTFVFDGNDGGIWRSTDDGAHWTGTGLAGAPTTINAGGLQTTLFYNLDVRKDGTASVSEGSLQDNGTVRTTGGLAWTDTRGGDGWDFGFDTAAPNQAYHSGGFYSSPSCTRVFRSNDSGATWPTAISDGNIPAAELDCAIFGGIQVHAVNVDPNNAGFVYVSGANSLFQTTDGGTTFRNLNNFGNRLGEVAVARTNSNNVVAGVRSQVWVSTNALASTVGPPSGVTFTNITRNLPGRDVTRVAFDPNDPTVIYATVSGFGTAAQPRNVFRTTIGGTAWTDISVPVAIPHNALALDGGTSPTTIYVGNDLGVLRSVDGGASWSVVDDLDLPNVPVTDLAINQQAGVLRAATFGRGVFELNISSRADLSITKMDSPDPVITGQNLTYTIVVTNSGPDTAMDVSLSDTLPAGVTFVAGSAGCSEAGGVVTCDLADVAAGDAVEITIIVEVDCALADGAILTNTVSVTAATPDPTQANNSATEQTTVSNPPPMITGVSANPSVLWPPNHKLVNVTVNYNVTDNCPLPPNSCTLSVTSNEPINGTGDGNTSPDWIILDAHHVQLRSERAGKGNGRTYTSTITCTDSGGSSSSQSVAVSVPHDKGRK